MRRRVLLVLLVTLAAMAGCGQGQGNGTGAPGPTRAPDDAFQAHILDAWTQFPATAKPRPIVLIGAPVVDHGYATGEAKAAALTGGYKAPATLPELPAPTAPVTLPDGEFTLPLVDARSALGTLQARNVQPNPTGPQLPITAVALGTATFRTDRGDLVLPAWLFTVKDGLAPIAVVAVAPSAFWHFEQDRYGGPPNPARVSADGRTVTVAVPQPTLCTGDVPTMQGVSIEWSTAVAVSAWAPVEPTGPQDCAAPAILRFMDVTVTLKAPLGGRVLVDSQGNVIAAVTN
jgi:hypothetical protein